VNRLTIVAAPAAPWAQPGRLAWMGVLAAAYYASARFGYTLNFSGPVAATVWLPAGVGIAFLTLAGVGFWPGVLIGDLFANDYSVLPVGSAVAQTAGNVLEVVVAAWLIRRTLDRDDPFHSPLEVVRIIGALAIGCAISATIGVTSSTIGGATELHAAGTIWRTWLLGDWVGALLVVPLALAWARPLPRMRWRERGAEFLAAMVAIVVLEEIAFHNNQPLTYLAFPLLIWIALRFGERGATLAVVLVSALAIWNTTHYLGPFVFHSITRSVLTTQLFIAVAAITTLFLEAVVSERERLNAEVLSSRVRLLEASDRERRQLERNLHDGAQQRLVALSALVSGARTALAAGSDRADKLLERAEAEAREANNELRELASGIHPSVLTDFGLAHALRSVAQRSAIPVVLRELPGERLDDTVEATAYYLVAEAVANAQKHAGATHVWVGVRIAGDRLWIEIADDGVGGAEERSRGGLEGLRDRVEAIGGHFRVRSPASRGTAITAILPL
jgi:signal transduction histidine kinase